MHILEIPSFFTPYGGEFCLEQAKALKALGHEVRILSNVLLGFTIGGKDFLVLPSCRFEHEREGITIYQSYQRGWPRMVHHNVKHWVGIVRSMFADYVAKYGKPDILHAHCAKWAGYAAMLISREYGIPYVITEHLPKLILEPELGPAPSTAWQVPLLKEAYHEAAQVITVSDELVAELADYFGHDFRHITIGNVVDTDFYAFKKRRLMDGRRFAFCCPAVFNHRKGYDVLFKAFALLAKVCPETELHIAGRGTDSKDCRKLMRFYGLKGNVTCHGTLDADGVRHLYYQSDALVLATRNESQGLVIAEAMSTGIPAISTQGVPKSMQLDGGYRYVPVGDAEALMVEMQKAVGRPVTEEEGRHLAELVERRFAPNVIGAQIAEVMTGTWPRS
ncbi:MAG: glycosyltransferase family 4 protein [Prevotella ruminicola]|uniref:Glycosyltransferase family 4 protein n=1 Tax=Xylanibacter ruminicola TaxID=839 RepID=A0A9D5S7T3_XYLRU|nr:glycosyltransferase family 4 protein [Xylanibacter ruminicola]